MIRDIMQSSSVERLKSLLKSRYGKGLELSFINDTDSAEMLGTSVLSVSGTLHVPLYSHGQFLAVAKIPEARELESHAQDAISEIVKMILEPVVYRWLQDAQAQTHRFYHFGSLKVVDATMTSTELDAVETSVEKKQLVYLQSNNPHRLHRLGLMIHECTERWAFLSWRDVRDQIRKVQDLQEMGNMTILIQDILELTPAEKDLIETWLESASLDLGPLLILGAHAPWEHCRDEGWLKTQTLHAAGLIQIDGDRLPADTRTCTEALRLLLDNDLDNESELSHH